MATESALQRQSAMIGGAERAPRPSVAHGRALRLKRTNLDLLPVLGELLRTRSVSRTARSLGITQPAVSQALRQLRAIFGDDLLVPLGRDLAVTERAIALSRPLDSVLDAVDALLQPETRFDPKTEALNVVIHTADYVTLLVAPILAEIGATEAPQVVFEFVSGGNRTRSNLTEVDFLIAPRAFGRTLGKRVGAIPLWRDEIVCIAAARNAAVPSQISPAEFRALRQAAFQTGPGVPDKIRMLLQPTSALETHRICTLPDFLVLGAVVDQADCVALVPRKVAEELVRWRDLKIVELAYPSKHLAIDAYWSLAAGNRRGHAWCRDVLARAAARVTRE